MLRRLAIAAGLCAGLMWGPVFGLGLGDIVVNSGLNQRFSAFVPFTSLTDQEAGELRVRLADNAEFARLGLERPAYLSTLAIDVVTQGEAPRIQISSPEIAREPLLTLLLDVRAGAGPRVLREYTVFLDPPELASRPAGAPQPLVPATPPAPVAAPVPSTAPPSAAPLPPLPRSLPKPAAPQADAQEFFQTPEERVPPAAMPADRYGPVRPGDTLDSITASVQPQGVSRPQAALAIFRANPSAFSGGAITGLRLNAQLVVPDAEAMRAIDETQARAELRRLAQPPAAAPEDATEAVTDAVTDERASTSPAAPPAPEAATPASAVPTAPPAAPVADGAVADSPVLTAEHAEQVEQEAAAPVRASAPAQPEPAAADSSLWNSPLLLVLAGLLLLGLLLLALRAWRERRAQREYEAAVAPRSPRRNLGVPAAVAPVVAAPRGSLETLEDLERRLDEAAPQSEPLEPDAAREIPAPSPVAPVVEPSLEAPAALPVIAGAAVGGVLEEARQRLDFGLYDEAAAGLNAALDQEPWRSDLRLLLAEALYRGGQRQAFVDNAQWLQSQTSAEDWARVSRWGRELAPQSLMFAQASAEAPTTPVDIGPLDAGDPGLDFHLDELEPLVAGATPGTTPEARALELELGEFDLGEPASQAGAAPPAPVAPRQEPAHEAPRLRGADKPLEFDLSALDLAAPAEPAPAPGPPPGNVLDFEAFDIDLSEVTPAPARMPAMDPIEPLVLDESPLDDAPADAEALDLGDDAATKLDLARVYVEMGDTDMARSLLDDVAREGSEAQKREASSLRERLPA